MNTIEQIIQQIETTNYDNVDDAIKAVGELSSSLKIFLCERINQMDESVNEAMKRRMLGVANLWNPAIEWTCQPEMGQPQIVGNSLMIPMKYKVTIVSKTDSLLGVFLSNLCRELGSGLLKYNEEALLNALYSHYRNLKNCKGLMVESEEDRKRLSVEDDLEYLIKMYFRVTFVSCEGRYATGDYFEMDQANVPNSTTTKKALVSSDDGILCLQKGRFVSPFNTNNNDKG